MSIRSAVRLFLVVPASCLAFASIADEAADSTAATEHPGWDCWVSTELKQVVVSYSIRCIRAREAIPAAAPADPPTDSPPALLLDIVHKKIHQGNSIDIDVDLAAGRLAEVSPYIRQIRIHQYPYVESWSEGRPQQLVRAALCPANPDCPVLVSR